MRSAFRSRLTGKVDPVLIEFFMGHSIGAEKAAYINLPNEELRELYANNEHLLTLEKTSKEEVAESRIARMPSEHESRIERLEKELERHKELLDIRDAEIQNLKDKQDNFIDRHNHELKLLWKILRETNPDKVKEIRGIKTR